MTVDDWSAQDNRKYKYGLNSKLHRAEYSPIENWIPQRSKVIDFGCGDGSLLKLLEAQKKVSSLGYEISDSGVQACRSKNLSAVCDRIDVLHPELEYKSFDYAICNVTIQMVEFPEILISEMARVAAHQVISFPNFAYYKNRLDMLIQGRMPQPMMFGYEWFSTGHIHQLSIRDFRDFIKKNTNLKIRDETHIGSNTFGINFLRESFPNLFSSISIFLLSEDL
ncbi:MAG: methionine biosynthesis protein MetW [Cyanobacteria bacterium J06649_11]